MKSSFEKPQEAIMDYTTNQLEYIRAAPSEATETALRIIGQLDKEEREEYGVDFDWQVDSLNALEIILPNPSHHAEPRFGGDSVDGVVRPTEK